MIIRKGTTPNGTRIQIEDWSENYTFHNKNATIGFYPMALENIYREDKPHWTPYPKRGETFRASFIDWARSLSNMKGAITVIYSNMKRNKMDPKVLEILEKLREYNTNVTRYNLEIGDIVRTPDGTYRYKV